MTVLIGLNLAHRIIHPTRLGGHKVSNLNINKTKLEVLVI